MYYDLIYQIVFLSPFIIYAAKRGGREIIMRELIDELNALSWPKKLILALPAFDLIWCLYRLAKSIDEKNTGGIVLAAVFILFYPYVAIFDIVYLMIKKDIWWFH